MDHDDTGGGGFSAEPDALRTAARQVREAATPLADSLESVREAPNAGISSGIVADAVARVHAAGVVLSGLLTQIAGEVDATRGSYAEFDNTVAGRMRWENSPQDTPVRDHAVENGLLLTSTDTIAKDVLESLS